MPKLYAARRFFLFPFSKCSFSDPLSVMNRLFTGCAARDRFGLLNHFGPFDWVDEKDDVPVADDSVPFGTLMDNKAKEILAKDCLVTVSWSGGVDSSGIVVALLKNGIAPEQLQIIHSASSKIEHPWLYKYLLSKQVKMLETAYVTPTYSRLTEGVLVSGWCADQLFGSNIHLRNLDLYNLPWIDGVVQAIKDEGVVSKAFSLDAFEEAFTAYADYVGVKLEQFCEFAWLYNFGVKWSYVAQDVKLACINQESRDRVINFYEDLPFQRWSIAQFDSLREHNVNRNAIYYKRPIKQYIYEYTGDADYLTNKGKVDSWSKVSASQGPYIVRTLDTEGYHGFWVKNNPRYTDWVALNNAVMHKYFKEGYEE